MPTRKLINDYTFYKIVNINGDIELCYVGSTVNFNERVRAHRQTCNNKNDKNFNNKLYTTIREHGGWCEFKMLPIGTAEQLTLTQARIIEEEYRIKLNAKLNSNKCFNTPEQTKQRDYEYRKNHKEELAEYYEKNKEKIAEYNENNKEKIAAQHKEYREKNKEKLAAQHKEYYNKNKENLAAQLKEYREKNKQVIAEKNKKKITCECGCIVNKYLLPRHKQTPKHIKIMEEMVQKINEKKL